MWAVFAYLSQSTFCSNFLLQLFAPTFCSNFLLRKSKTLTKIAKTLTKIAKTLTKNIAS